MKAIAIAILATVLLAGCETTALGYRKTAGGAYTTQTMKNVTIYGNVTFGKQSETGTNEMAGTASGLTADAKVDRTAVGGNDAGVDATK